MKRKVVLEISENEVYINDMYNDCILAAYALGDGHVMIITKIDFEYRSVWLYTDQMQNYIYQGSDIKRIVTEMIDDGLTVYQFEDEIDFSKWLEEMFDPDNPKVADEKPQEKSEEYYNSRP